jgi:hypothetical protein
LMLRPGRLGLPLLCSLQLVMGGLQLLDWLGAVYYSPSRVYVVFSLGFSLLWPMALCMAAWVAAVHRLGTRRLLLAAVPAVLAAFDAELGVSLASLSMSVVGAAWVVGWARYLDAVMLVLTAFNGLAVLSRGVLLPLGFSGALAGATRVQVGVHFLVGWVVPLTLYVFMFFWLLRPLAGQAWRLPAHSVQEGGATRLGVALLVFSVYLSIYLSLYPYLSAVNPHGLSFGADMPRYVRVAEAIAGSEEPLREIVVVGRGFYFVFFFAFQWLTGLDTVHAARLVPALLNPMFVLASFLFAWECLRSFEAAAWCSFFASTGFVVTLGTSIYLVSNTLALVMALLSLALLFRASRLGDKGCLAAASVLCSLLVFTHPWTLDQYMAAALCSLAVLWVRGRGGGSDGGYLLTYMGVVGLAELLAHVFSVGDSGASSVALAVEGVLAPGGVWSSTLSGFLVINGGLASNLVLILLAIVGVCVVEGERRWVVFVSALVFLSSLVFLFGDAVVKTRLLYNVPLQLYAAVGLDSVKERSSPLLFFYVVVYSLFYVFIAR